MMKYIKSILPHLRKPSVIISLTSQVIAIFALLNISVDAELINSLVFGVCEIFVVLGIFSNPNTKNKWYGDDVEFCEKCAKETLHSYTADGSICEECGAVAEDTTPIADPE